MGSSALLFAPGVRRGDRELRETWGSPSEGSIVRDSADTVADASIDHVVVLGGIARPKLVAEALRILKPGGTCTLHELCGRPGHASPALGALVDMAQVQKSLLYAGFVEPSPVQPASTEADVNARKSDLVSSLFPVLASMSAQADARGAEATDALRAIAFAVREGSDLLTVAASKPSYSAGTTFSLRNRAQLPTAQAVPDATLLWAEVAAGAAPGEGAGDAELMDEDELLESADAALPPKSGTDQCTPQTRKKACANCSCGLKEIEESQANQMPPPKSSCGNCGLGDAFRCEGCPYRGVPAFKPGEEVKLAASMMEPQAIAASSASAKARGDGVVQVDMSMDADF